MFNNVGPGYYGDLDEADGDLLKFEKETEAEGAFAYYFPLKRTLTRSTAAWEDALDHLRETHGLDIPQPPPLPTPSYISLDPSAPTPAPEEPAAPGSKRKASAASTAAAAKKAKLASGAAERTGNGFMSVLKAEDLRPPTLLSMEEMEAYIVAQQKAALLAEYGA